MKLGSMRSLEELKPVLRNPDSSGPDPVYWVFSEITAKSSHPELDSGSINWANVTIIAPGNFNREYPKTYGHYHGTDVNETYHLIEGEGVLMMQKKHFEGGKWVPEMVDKVVLIKAKPGDEVIITPEWGHAWSNIGKGPLISFDDWRAGHNPTDYEVMERLHGMAYYLIEENGKIKAIPNPNYEQALLSKGKKKNLPKPQWLSAEEFKQK